MTDHLIAVHAYNKPGIIEKITGLFTRRGFNIKSFSAGKSMQDELMRSTIIVEADDRSIDQIKKQLYKILETVKVSPINQRNKVEREMALIKIKFSNPARQSDLFNLVNMFNGKMADAGPNGFIIEITGPTDKIDAFINLLQKNTIEEIARTGIVAMNRWEQRPEKNKLEV
jgi:acetolactate synthase-1/3 small subunit